MFRLTREPVLVVSEYAPPQIPLSSGIFLRTDTFSFLRARAIERVIARSETTRQSSFVKRWRLLPPFFNGVAMTSSTGTSTPRN